MRKTIPWTRGERIVRWSVFAGLFVLVAVRREVREEAGMGSELNPDFVESCFSKSMTERRIEVKTKPFVLASLGCLLLSAVVIAAVPHEKQHALQVGKRGEIILSQKTKVGDKVLEPDTYVVQHRVSHDDHFVRFVELKQVEYPTTEVNNTYTEADNVGEIKCRVEPTTEPITETTVYTINEGGVPRITKVAIKGESVWHILQ